MKLTIEEVRTTVDSLRLGLRLLIANIEDSTLPDDDAYPWGRLIGMLDVACGTLDATLKAPPLETTRMAQERIAERKKEHSSGL